MSERSIQKSEQLQPRLMRDQVALDAVAPFIYQGPRRLAHHHLKSVRAAHPLQSTVLWISLTTAEREWA